MSSSKNSVFQTADVNYNKTSVHKQVEIKVQEKLDENVVKIVEFYADGTFKHYFPS